MVSYKRYTGLLLGLALAACSGASVVEPTGAPPTATPTPAPTLTPTPAPELVLVAEGNPPLGERLRFWAAERAWGLRLVNPPGAASVLTDPQIDARMVVSLEQPLPFELSAPTVLVQVEGAAPQARVSTVGTPATHQGEAGFLAGLMVGLTSQVEWVGSLTATGAPQEAGLLAGFEQGLKLGCPRCRLVSLSLAEATVDGFRGRGVDVVFVPPAAETLPIATALGEAGVWLVWIGELPEDLPSGAVAGRVGFELERLLFGALEALAAGQGGQAWPFAIHNGGLSLADINPQAISPGRQRLLEEHFQAVASGELSLGLDPGQ